MNELPNDYSRCSNTDCLKREQCARAIFPENDFVPVTRFPGGDCEWFIKRPVYGTD